MEDQSSGAMPPQGPMFEDAGGFFGSLFDFDFKSFVTPKIIKLIFMILLVLGAMWTLVVIAGAFRDGTLIGILVLILSPIIFLIVALFSRVYLELVIVLFRIYEVLRDRPA